MRSAHVRVYADAWFAINEDLSSPLGFIFLVADRITTCQVLDYSSMIAKRIVRSIMAGEGNAFGNALDSS